MGRMKEVFAQHQEEQEFYETYYKELHYVAQIMGSETKQLKEFLTKEKNKKQKNGLNKNNKH